jgi:hypothetical protein
MGGYVTGHGVEGWAAGGTVPAQPVPLRPALAASQSDQHLLASIAFHGPGEVGGGPMARVQVSAPARRVNRRSIRVSTQVALPGRQYPNPPMAHRPKDSRREACAQVSLAYWPLEFLASARAAGRPLRLVGVGPLAA